MGVVPGTSVVASFQSFTGHYPPLYYRAGDGSLNLASVNAGNSDGLCVGLGGINAGFYTALTNAGQSGANLDPQPEVGGQKGCSPLPTKLDDYQGRHQNLLAKAGSNLTAFESYQTTNPTAFSYVNASRVNTVSGWHDGICYADIFDPKLRPAANTRNMAMLYVAPPYGQNYADKTAFLAAIQATAENMIDTVAGYNAIAAQHGQPVIEALRNCLYSSNNYAKAGVTHDEVARAIFAGLQAGLHKNPKSGLKELQFPVNPGGVPLFDAVERDLSPGLAPMTPAYANTAKAPGFAESAPTEALWQVPGEPGDTGEDNTDDDDDDPDAIEMDDLGQAADPNSQQVNNMPSTSAATQIDQGASADNAALGSGQPSNEYGYVGKVENPYEQTHEPLGGGVEATAPEEAQQKAANQPVVDSDPLGKARLMVKAAPKISETDGALAHSKHTRVHCEAVLEEAEAYKDAKNLKEKKLVLDNCARALGKARAAADAANQAVENTKRGDGAEEFKKYDREYSKVAEEYFDGAKATYDGLVKDYNLAKRAKAEAGTKPTRVIAIITILSAFVVTGALVWTFVFGFGRKVVRHGMGRFESSDLSVDAESSDASVTVDVLQKLSETTGTEKLSFIKSVELVDKSGAALKAPGNWSVSDKVIKYTHTPGDTAPASVHFVLVGEGPVAPAKTDPAKLTINFVAKTMSADDPTDIVKSAGDRTMAVTFDVPSGFQFQDEGDQDGWTHDSETNKVTFKPTSPLSDDVLVKANSFTLKPMGNPANLVILFPPSDISQNVDRATGGNFPALATTADGVSADLTLGTSEKRATTLDATATKDGKSFKVGEWSIKGEDKQSVSFAPDNNLNSSVTTIDVVSFALVYGDVRSKSAKITATLKAAGQAPDAKDQAKITGNRSAKVVFPAVGGALVGAASDANGDWAVDQANNAITFTPKPGLAAGETTVSVSYTVTDTTGTSKPAKLSVTFLPAPVDVVRNKVSRIVAANAIDLTQSPAITSAYSLQFWDGSNSTTASVRDANKLGTWSVDDASKDIVFTKATGLFDPDRPKGARVPVPFTAASATIKYVLAGPDGVSDTPGTITLNFETTKPHAYGIGKTVMTPSPSVTVRLGSHIIMPSGVKLKAIYLGKTGTKTTENTGAGTFEVVDLATNPGIKLTPKAGVTTRSNYAINYRIVDGNDQDSVARLVITVDKDAMPQMRNFLLAMDVSGGKATACKVMDNASTFFKPDPKSLVFVGLNSTVGGGIPAKAMIKKDGKAISVPGQGTWMISDENAVVFQSDKALSGPPTPALIRYSDVKGNTSNIANVMIDPALSALKTLKKTVEADDTKFWAGCLKHILKASPPPTPEEFITATSSLSGVARSQLKRIGRDPVSEDALAAAYKSWDDAGQPADPSDGDGTNDVLALSKAAVRKGLGSRKTPFLERFWTLEMIARMATRALPDDT